MTDRTVKIKELIHEEVCMGTYGLVELELLEIEKEMERLMKLIPAECGTCEHCKRFWKEEPCRDCSGYCNYTLKKN